MRRHGGYDGSIGCPVEATLELIDGKWKGVLLFLLLEHECIRFNAFQRILPWITQRMLTKQLRELEQDGLVTRTVYPEVPPRVEYRLSDHGRTLEPVLLALRDWGAMHRVPVATGCERPQ
ncbi:helix-turn-helix domain-containing protein [Jeongeupia wiesaeckerbachi]|uniref:winged helix-turn-helix transcriptional regulator n=1 Tax=Jeongeupia wiesaeckerbachi TaxID=3051218 RepID=UPI003D8068D4